MKKIYVYSIILFLFFLGACSKEEIKLYSGDVVYISFVKNSTQDSAMYSFKTYPEGEIVAEIPVQIHGAYLTEPRSLQFLQRIQLHFRQRLTSCPKL